MISQQHLRATLGRVLQALAEVGGSKDFLTMAGFALFTETHDRSHIMKSSLTAIFPGLVLSAFTAAGAAQADTLPAGGIPASGSFVISTEVAAPPTPFPIEVPDGMVFVLTDISFARGAGDISLFAPDDLTNPRFGFYKDSVSGAGIIYSFQTGLVFSGPPAVKASGGDFSSRARISFSGYLKPAS